eukprot:scaffold163072_cov35-Tisochrysis_lutea.AAC.2
MPTNRSEPMLRRRERKSITDSGGGRAKDPLVKDVARQHLLLALVGEALCKERVVMESKVRTEPDDDAWPHHGEQQRRDKQNDCVPSGRTSPT